MNFMVHFRLRKNSCFLNRPSSFTEHCERVDTSNANFARQAVEERHPGAIVYMLLPGAPHMPFSPRLHRRAERSLA